jgi:hypothetical protein
MPVRFSAFEGPADFQLRRARIFHSLRHRYDRFWLAIPMLANAKRYTG